MSKDGTVAKADVVVKTNDGEANKEDLKSVFATIKKANTASLDVGVSGRVFDFVGGDPPKSAEGIGIAVALVIMALMFGAVVAAGLPIITAVFGLATGLAAVTLFTGFDRIGKQAADSPLIRQRGDQNQFSIGLGFGYRFGWNN